MTGCIPRLRRVAAWCLGLALAMTPALVRAQTQIHPAGGAQGGPKVIAILADHFQGDQETAFNDIAADFVQFELLSDPDYAANAQSLTIKTIFQAWTPGGAESNYGFVAQAGVTNCSVSWDNAGTDTATLVAAAAAPADPTGVPPYIVVIGNHDFPFGCAHANWVYVSVEAYGDKVLPHELGHLLGGLFDEYAREDQVDDPHPNPPDYLNCATSETGPHWGPGLGPPQAECALYGVGIFHPTTSCKMISGNRGPFCGVCRARMDSFFNPNPELDNPGIENPDISNPAPKPPAGLRISGAGFFGALAAQTPPTPPPSVQPPAQPPAAQVVNRSVRVLIELSTGVQNGRVLRATDATGPVVRDFQRRGDYVYEISENNKPLAIGLVTGDPFATRSYQGGGPRHTIATAPTGTVLVTIPGESRQSLAAPNRAVEIWVYRLGAGVGPAPISPGRFLELKAKDLATRVFRIPSDVLKTAMQ